MCAKITHKHIFFEQITYSILGDIMHKLKHLMMLILLILFYSQADDITKVSKEGLNFWFEQLVPSMFISITVIQWLSQTSFFTWIAQHLRPLCFILNLNEEALGLIISCLLLGCPANVVLINEAYTQQRITEKMVLRLLLCTPVTTISFLIMNAGAMMLNSIWAGFVLWLIQLFGCFVLLLITRGTMIEASPSLSAQKKHSVTSAFYKSGSILFLIGGYLLMFQTIILLIQPIFPDQIQSLLKILSEFSYGCFLISERFCFSTAFVLMSALCGFNGLCVQFQAISLSEIKIPIFQYGCYRILQGLLATLISITVLPLLL